MCQMVRLGWVQHYAGCRVRSRVSQNALHLVVYAPQEVLSKDSGLQVCSRALQEIQEMDASMIHYATCLDLL